MSYFVDCTCYRLTPIWDNMDSVNCILPQNYCSCFIPVPTFLPVYTQCFKDNTCILSLHTSCGREWSWVFGLKCIPLWGQQGLFNCEVWCSWCDFCGNMDLCVYVRLFWRSAVSMKATASVASWHYGCVYIRACPRCCNVTSECVCTIVWWSQRAASSPGRL